MKGCFSIGNSTISAMLLCRDLMSSFRHRAAFFRLWDLRRRSCETNWEKRSLDATKDSWQGIQLWQVLEVLIRLGVCGWFLDVWYGVFEGL